MSAVWEKFGQSNYKHTWQAYFIELRPVRELMYSGDALAAEVGVLLEILRIFCMVGKPHM